MSDSKAPLTEGTTLFCMNNLNELGIQRVVTWIVNNWPEAEVPCALSLHDRSGKLSEFLASHVQVFELDRIVRPISGFSAPFRVLAYWKLLRQLKPHTVIAVNQFEALALCIVKRFYPHFRLVVCEHCHVSSNISKADAHPGWFGWYYRKFFEREYKTYADLVHTVSFDAAEDLRRNFGMPTDKLRVIYNPVDMAAVCQLAEEPLDHPWLQSGNNTVIAASRLEAQKRLDVLLRAWKLVVDEAKGISPPPRLIICGDGSQRLALERLADDLGLEPFVLFVGFQSNPWKWIARSSLVVSTSEWEGLPCTLIEAQVLGVPVLSSNCTSGPREILLDGQAGYLVEVGDIAGTARQISHILSNRGDAIKRSMVALDHLHRFELRHIIEQYASLRGNRPADFAQ